MNAESGTLWVALKLDVLIIILIFFFAFRRSEPEFRGIPFRSVPFRSESQDSAGRTGPAEDFFIILSAIWPVAVLPCAR